LIGVAAIMVMSALGSLWNGPVDPTKFGTAADWAMAFGTVGAVSLALWHHESAQRSENQARQVREQRQAKRLEIAVTLPELRSAYNHVCSRASEAPRPSLVGEIAAQLDAQVAIIGQLGLEADETRHALTNHVSDAEELMGAEWAEGRQLHAGTAWIDRAEELAQQAVSEVEQLLQGFVTEEN
jgi:hypothetical protein